MRITKEQYLKAVEDKKACEKIINKFFYQKAQDFKERLKNNPIFTKDELIYSAISTCPCGHGLAYPKDCEPGHYWDCAGILLGVADKNVEHTGKLPFAFYDIKSENYYRGTTRNNK